MPSQPMELQDQPTDLSGFSGQYTLGTQVLQRLVAEWRLARAKMGISGSATVMEIAAKLNVDRGTAQRLKRIAKIVDVTPADLGYFPGIRGWHRVLIGVEAILSSENPAYQTLSLAMDHFAAWLESAGGSRSAAIRRNQRVPEHGGMRSSGETGRESARARWVDAASEVMGYSVEVCCHIQIIRQTPQVVPPRIDVSSLHVLKNCRGTRHAMPIAFSSASFAVDHKVLETAGGDDPRSFYILRNITSKPAPAILSAGDNRRQTIFVEPNWASMSEPLSLALLHGERGAMELVWGTPNEWYEFAFIVRHPSRKLILERIVCRDIDRKCAASIRAFRSHVMMAHEEPWYERIPEETQLRRFDTVAEAMMEEPMPGYALVLTEALERLKWDIDDLVVYRAVIEDPIPLATYFILFDRVR